MSLLNIDPQLWLTMPSEGEWLLVLIVVLVLFGGKKIPELAKGIGKGIREFNDAKDGVKKEIESGMKKEDQPVNNTNTAANSIQAPTPTVNQNQPMPTSTPIPNSTENKS
ncbi:MAG TPA: twin-arginine translocase TatA/TatE family subunit [Flavipsychrobacter sp.]|nr:twin-arginine translocase TatA/TatE family subunit [Flavipsychrobacter sp.]